MRQNLTLSKPYLTFLIIKSTRNHLNSAWNTMNKTIYEKKIIHFWVTSRVGLLRACIHGFSNFSYQPRMTFKYTLEKPKYCNRARTSVRYPTPLRSMQVFFRFGNNTPKVTHYFDTKACFTWNLDQCPNIISHDKNFANLIYFLKILLFFRFCHKKLQIKLSVYIRICFSW